MSALFKELAYAKTPIGELVLRRRRQLSLDVDVYEIKLDEEFLMSSLFTVAEEELARLGLAAVNADHPDVVVGGLGLGYTARAALEDESLKSLIVIEALPDVIAWHKEKILPLGETLTADPRCRFVQGDFFAMVKEGGFDPEQPDRLFDAILLDIDHTPAHTLDDSHAGFYSPEGLKRLIDHLNPGGVFAMWSNDPRPDESFCARLQAVFPEVEVHIVSFDNPLQNRESANTVYVACSYL